MISPRFRFLVFAALLCAPRPARADYLSAQVPLDPAGTPSGSSWGTVQVEGYDGVGPAGGGLSAGQVRITFEPNFGPQPASGVAGLINYTNQGFQALAFNTDLSLSASQISLPVSWHAFPSVWLGEQVNGTYTSYGKYSWALGTTTNFQNSPILISGLGANATPAHFLFPSDGSGPPGGPNAVALSADFAGLWTSINFSNDFGASSSSQWFVSNASAAVGGEPPTSTPEPSALALAGFGLAALLGRRVLRRRGRVAVV
jgi:hypothetical protein